MERDKKERPHFINFPNQPNVLKFKPPPHLIDKFPSLFPKLLAKQELDKSKNSHHRPKNSVKITIPAQLIEVPKNDTEKNEILILSRSIDKEKLKSRSKSVSKERCFTTSDIFNIQKVASKYFKMSQPKIKHKKLIKGLPSSELKPINNNKNILDCEVNLKGVREKLQNRKLFTNSLIKSRINARSVPLLENLFRTQDSQENNDKNLEPLDRHFQNVNNFLEFFRTQDKNNSTNLQASFQPINLSKNEVPFHIYNIHSTSKTPDLSKNKTCIVINRPKYHKKEQSKALEEFEAELLNSVKLRKTSIQMKNKQSLYRIPYLNIGKSVKTVEEKQRSTFFKNIQSLY